MPTARHPPIFQTVPADEFTDREEIIGRLLWLAERTPRDLTISTSIVGRRRLGKTVVLEEVYNRLFWEQKAVVPIYFVFEARPKTSTAFAEAYFTSFLRQYVAFRRQDDALARNRQIKLAELLPLVAELGEASIGDYTRGMVNLLKDPTGLGVMHQIIDSAICAPREVMEYNRRLGQPETPIFVMLDEFQEVLKIYYADGTPADAVGMYQWAVEGRQAPHIVTGSAIRLINQEVLGTGALFGRFRYLEFPPLEDIFALELVDKLARKYSVRIEEPVAGYLAARCGGSPFYIQSALWQAADQHLATVANERAVDELLAHELTHGQIWRDWSGQLQRYFEQLNSHLIAKRVLFHAAQAGEQMIAPETIAAEVKRPVEEVQRVLRQLAFADMIDASAGYLFYNVRDPLLREFIRVQYLLDVARQPADLVIQELQAELARWRGKYADAVGALVEARLAALMHRFDGRTVPGRLFHTAGEVELPKFDLVYDTVVKEAGDRARQLDLVGSRWHGAQETMWLVEIKHWRARVDVGVVREFIATCQAFSRSRKLPTERMVPWLVNHGLSRSPEQNEGAAEGTGGFTAGALAAMAEAGVYYSGAAEINELLRTFGLERLLGAATS